MGRVELCWVSPAGRRMQTELDDRASSAPFRDPTCMSLLLDRLDADPGACTAELRASPAALVHGEGTPHNLLERYIVLKGRRPVRPEVLQALAELVDVNRRTPSLFFPHMTPLGIAVQCLNVSAVEGLLEAGCDVGVPARAELFLSLDALQLLDNRLCVDGVSPRDLRRGAAIASALLRRGARPPEYCRSAVVAEAVAGTGAPAGSSNAIVRHLAQRLSAAEATNHSFLRAIPQLVAWRG